MNLYELASCGYLTSTPSGKIVKVKPNTARLAGLRPRGTSLRPPSCHLLTPGGRIFYQTHFSLLLRVQERVNKIALDFACKDGRVIPALVNARQKRNDRNEPVLNQVTIFNATERRMYEGN